MLRTWLAASFWGVCASVDLSKVCCFRDSDVKVSPVGNTSWYLLVDGFFCQPFIDFIDQLAGSSLDQFRSDNFFPGWRWRLPADNDKNRLAAMRQKAQLSAEQDEFLEALFGGYYLKCVARASAAADFKLFPGSIFDSAFESKQAGFLSMVNRRPTTLSNLHIDEGQAVVNIHLGCDSADTATAFFHSQSGQEQCAGDEDALRACKHLISKVFTFNLVNEARLLKQPVHGPCADALDDCAARAAAGKCSTEAETMHRDCRLSCAVCSGFWIGPHLPAAQDHSGTFVKHHEIPFKFNRMVLYSGHLFHSSSFSREALIRIEDAYEICLKGVSGDGLGMSLSPEDDKTVVGSVQAGGVVDKWNVANPRQQVKEGSYVLEVNGKRGKTAVLQSTIASAEDVCVVVSPRSPDSFVSATGRLTMQHFVPSPALAPDAMKYAKIDGLVHVMKKVEHGQQPEVEPAIYEMLQELSKTDGLDGRSFFEHASKQVTVRRAKSEEL